MGEDSLLLWGSAGEEDKHDHKWVNTEDTYMQILAIDASCIGLHKCMGEEKWQVVPGPTLGPT